MATAPEPGTSFTSRLAAATNLHDVDKVVDCFTQDYVNLTPVHPARGFVGREQVRRNWSQIFAMVPDLVATPVTSHRHGDEVWSEWEMRGRRRDGADHLMRGVIAFTVTGQGDQERARSARFYLEVVDTQPLDADGAVRHVLGDAAR
jgi:ketosteroid isomerase-like protein